MRGPSSVEWVVLSKMMLTGTKSIKMFSSGTNNLFSLCQQLSAVETNLSYHVRARLRTPSTIKKRGLQLILLPEGWVPREERGLEFDADLAGWQCRIC